LWASFFFVSLTFSYLKVYLEGDHLLLIRKPYHIFFYKSQVVENKSCLSKWYYV
jgi:hypothetical protein